ncbi:hypothetical protein BH20ACT6_BH20ACT6_01210 [soil metagenome]
MMLMLVGLVLFPVGLLGLVLLMATLEDGLVDGVGDRPDEVDAGQPDRVPQPAPSTPTAHI